MTLSAISEKRLSRRILLCPSAYYPSFGGVEEICRNLAGQLRQLGMTVAIAVNRWPEEAQSYEVLWDVPVYRFDLFSPSRAHFISTWKMLPALTQFQRFIDEWKPDVVHVICPTTNTFYLWLSQLIRRQKLLLTLQGELFMDSTHLFERSGFARWSLKQLLSVTDGITACSNYVLEDASRRFVMPKVGRKVVFNGVSLQEHSHGRCFERPFVLGVGRMVQNKGFDCLINAFASIACEFPEYELVLAGDGDYRHSLENVARNLGIEQRVRFTGRLGREQISALYSSCAVFVLPSPLEPFGIVCLEAMRAGRPIIASDAGGPSEFIRDGVDGVLVQPDDVDAFAGALRSLLSDPDQRDRLGANALQTVQQFSWEHITAQYVSTYQSLLDVK